MSHLERRITINCPLAQAAARLQSFYAAHGSADGDVVRLSLQASVDVPGVPNPVVLQRAVIATIHKNHLPADMTPRYRVEWAPEVPGPFPLFGGELFVEGDNYETFVLSLAGDYTPPLGLLGKGFDALVGKRIADATASNLLERIKSFVESEFTAGEAAKSLRLEPRP
jgi:hypothetical protein